MAWLWGEAVAHRQDCAGRGSSARMIAVVAIQRQPTIAKRIIEGRPYRTIDDLLKVKGIGEKRFETIRLLVKAKWAERLDVVARRRRLCYQTEFIPHL